MGSLSAKQLKAQQALLAERHKVVEQELDDLEPHDERDTIKPEDTEGRTLNRMIAEVDSEVVDHLLRELEDIELALERIESGRYGICIDCEGRIDRERLEAFPMAKRCLECKERFERESKRP